MLADKSVLDPLAESEEVIPRTEQEQQLARILAGVTEGYLPTTVSVYGPPGTRKTTVISGKLTRGMTEDVEYRKRGNNDELPDDGWVDLVGASLVGGDVFDKQDEREDRERPGNDPSTGRSMAVVSNLRVPFCSQGDAGRTVLASIGH